MTARPDGGRRPGVVRLGADELGRLRALAFRSGTVIERDGLSVLGFGRAAAFELPNGLSDPSRLATIGKELADFGPTAATLAIGALPFLPDAPGRLVVPEVCVVARRDEDPVAAVHGAGRPEPAVAALLTAAGELEPTRPPDSFVLRSARSHDDFCRRVAGAVDEIRGGRLEKVVLAREVVVEANRPLRQGDLCERLRSLHPSCATFAVEGFLGASPELLIRRAGRSLASHPLAGTAPRSGDPAADRRAEAALLASAKERTEHGAVVEAIARALAPLCEQLDVPETPEIVELRNVSHLGTAISGRLAAPSGTVPNALELLARIHPTPAVSGTPIEIALEYLAKVEELDRGRYAGAVGWLDADGDGEWHLGIRSAVVEGTMARLYAGVGIVEDSDPLAELAETQLKLQAVLAAAVRP